jgi:hypothetical protein
MKLDDVVTCKGFNVAERSVSYHCLLCRKAAYHAYVGRKRGLGSFDHDEEVSAYLTAGAEVRARRIDAYLAAREERGVREAMFKVYMYALDAWISHGDVCQGGDECDEVCAALNTVAHFLHQRRK